MTEPSGKTILIVEDETKLACLLADYLHQAGFATHHLADGRAVIPRVREYPPTLILLDILLPGRSGMDICREIRQFSNVPIFMVTARIEEIDRLLGLELGADDYICKPYSPREVVARIRALFRRMEFQLAPDELFVVQEACMEIRCQGQLLDLTPVEYRLLAILLRQPGRVYSRDQLLNQLYEDQRIVTDRTVDSHIKNIRKKIACMLPGRDIITSVYGVGYKLETTPPGPGL